MSVLRKGSIGTEVKTLQLRLNTHLSPSPRLDTDGVFGLETETAVLRFQRDNGLDIDGIVGPQTQQALAGPPRTAPPPNLAKFIAELGVLEDFVRHVASLEVTRTTKAEVFSGLINFFETSNKKRYLLVRGDQVGVIDFRHFFAAAAESYNSAFSSSNFGIRLGGNPGQTVLLGVANEVGQCVGETIERRFNSCFSPEDLGTNRLGAGFGEFVKVREAEASQHKVSQLLREYLTRLKPTPPAEVHSVTTASRWDTALEALMAIVAGISDILIPRAY